MNVSVGDELRVYRTVLYPTADLHAAFGFFYYGASNDVWLMIDLLSMQGSNRCILVWGHLEPNLHIVVHGLRYCNEVYFTLYAA